eukprot:269972-Amphidinium_carterae.1
MAYSADALAAPLQILNKAVGDVATGKITVPGYVPSCAEPVTATSSSVLVDHSRSLQSSPQDLEDPVAKDAPTSGHSSSDADLT